MSILEKVQTTNSSLKAVQKTVEVPDSQFTFDTGAKCLKQAVRDVEYAVYRPQNGETHRLNGQDTITIRIAKNSQHVLYHKAFLRMKLVPTVAGGAATDFAGFVIPGGNQGIIGVVDFKQDNHSLLNSKADQNMLHVIRRHAQSKQSNQKYLSDTNYYSYVAQVDEAPAISDAGGGLANVTGSKSFKRAVLNLNDNTGTARQLQTTNGAPVQAGAMITVYLHDYLAYLRYYKKVNFGSDIYMRLTLADLANLYVLQTGNGDVTAIEAKEVELWVPTVDPTKQQREIFGKSVNKLKGRPFPVNYLHEEIFTKVIPDQQPNYKLLYVVPNNKVRYLLVAFQEADSRTTKTIDNSQFPSEIAGTYIKSLQINYNGKSVLRQRYEFEKTNNVFTKGWRAYDDFRRFAGKGSCGDLNICWDDWSTSYQIFAFDLYELGTGGRFKVDNTSQQFEVEVVFAGTTAENKSINTFLVAMSEMEKEVVFANDHMRLRSGTKDS